ncbi:transglutaminase-like domain-containing protein [Marinibacterium profundimaris]|uniref:Transglutaminase n=1 Tax=Marinibacterium profundimaris TaxID=1679460 RepID=A0A225NIJ7_9RHOB|nr:transglutaminase family protein [Marinibacterium profundimaris]OWU73563.1 transglutaminase [Marinibacterium profundimaris]
MRLRLGCRMRFRLPADTPMILMLRVHPSRDGDVVLADDLATRPAVPVEPYVDGYGNRCARVLAPAGRFEVATFGLFHDAGLSDPVGRDARQQPVQDLPSEVLTYLLPSRYCETELVSDFAWAHFDALPPGWDRVQGICDFVHDHITFGYRHSRATRTAAEALAEGVGVCRDYTHLAIALCRSLNIPARYCTGYISDVGQPPPYPPMDFAAWMEVWLGDRWWVFDPRNNDTRFGRVLIARGRDAADVPLTHSFGQHELTDFLVWISEG